MPTFSLFGDMKRINRLPRLDGESFTSLFGDIKVDFTRTPLAPGDHTLSITTLFGDVKLRFPEDVAVSVDGFTIFGETEIETHSTGDEEKVGNNYETENIATAAVRVHLRVFSIFGDTDIVRVPVITRPATTENYQPQLEYREEPPIYDGATRRIDRVE